MSEKKKAREAEPVVFVRYNAPYNIGEEAFFKPEEAAKLIKSGVAVDPEDYAAEKAKTAAELASKAEAEAKRLAEKAARRAKEAEALRKKALEDDRVSKEIKSDDPVKK